MPESKTAFGTGSGPSTGGGGSGLSAGLFKPVSKILHSSTSSSPTSSSSAIISREGNSRRRGDAVSSNTSLSSGDHAQPALHIATPAKTNRYNLANFFTGHSTPSNSNTNSKNQAASATAKDGLPPVPTIPSQYVSAPHSMTSETDRENQFSGGMGSDEGVSARKIRANISVEAKVRSTITMTPGPKTPGRKPHVQAVAGIGGSGSTIRAVCTTANSLATSTNRPAAGTSVANGMGGMRSERPRTRPSIGGGSGPEILGVSNPLQQGFSTGLSAGNSAYQTDLGNSLANSGWQGAAYDNENDEDVEDQMLRVEGAKETVVVTIRVRPMPTSHINQPCAWSMPSEVSPYDGSLEQPKSIRLVDPGVGKESRKGKDWWFDQVLPPSTTNRQAFLTSALPLIRSAMQGYNAVVFAYGQTASGKSHTITGSAQEPGVIPLSVEEIFRIIKHEGDREWVLRASYLELYNENLFDLLSPEHAAGAAKPNDIQLLNGKKEGEVQINGLTEMVVTNVNEVKRVLALGESRRRTGCTDWNERSSRSHSVFRIVIESRSEKATASKERNAEGRHINQSLLTLKNVISKLAEQTAKKSSGHIPYRDSKLTRLLQPSLSGDAKISVICTINPAQSAIAESQSTLAFASGIKRVVLNAKQTEVVDPAALIQQYQNEIAELKAKLAASEAQTAADRSGNRRTTLAEREDVNRSNKRLAELKRLILTSNNVEEEDDREGIEENRASLQASRIDPERPSFALQQELHVATTKIDEQQTEIERLKKELESRPKNPDKRCQELQVEVERLSFVLNEYESGLLEPQQKVREDVEAEWRPRVEALEARAAEKEQFYKELYDSVHFLKLENAKLKERCDRLVAEKRQFLDVIREMDEPGHGVMIQPASDRPPLEESSVGSLENRGPNAPRNTSLSVKQLRGKMATNVAKKGMGLRSLQEDSMFDLARRAAEFEEDSEDFF